MIVLPFLLFLALSVLYSEATYNVTINATDTSLHFSSGWNVSQNSAGQQFLYINQLGTVLMVSLPNATSHVFLIGLKRPGGSAYGFCLDCNAQTNVESIVIVDGHDPALSNDSLAKIDFIFSSPLNPSQNHVLIMFNIPDIRFDNFSQVTFSSLIVTIENGEGQDSSSKIPKSSASSPIAGVTSTTSDIFSTWSNVKTSAASTSSSSVLSAEKEATWTPAISSSASSQISYVPADPSSQYTPSSSSLSSPIASTPRNDSMNPSGSSGSSDSASNDITPFSVNKSLIAVIVTLSSVAVLSFVLGLFLFFRQKERQTRRRLSEPLSFADRQITGPLELPIVEGLDSIGPLAAAGREPPPRRNVTSYANAVVGQLPGASSRQINSSRLSSRQSQDMWITRLVEDQI
ncbi:uncharacterized protein BT62DRAFT_991298 [Guyanagaster necrorhizus]|uniref:Uncharacterized protein n=1 Tax=Guyanagaster necrorhizus TaxID=856835 RepID=A0A9P7W2U6_9AGAR|nr:uncharacterized protein BT62DRAFT_991298 [Guyanagaster necrorhizus MCA 3950]KAG7450311.1 hypothetical protein BT62DRAFT_991298 [Guyanagaster necrorhizus MCA 3950]